MNNKIINELKKINNNFFFDEIDNIYKCFLNKNYYNILKKIYVNKFFKFHILKLHTAIDCNKEKSFQLVYIFYSMNININILLTYKLTYSKNKVITISNLWPIAEWMEREVYDMFGIIYKEHKDLRRIFLDDQWIGYPLKKEYTDKFILR